MLAEKIQLWYDENGEKVKKLAKELWDLAETAVEEYESCKRTAAFMEAYGFTVETFNCCDSAKPANTVVATWGSGHPVIGFIGEYDALPRVQH